jgi:hypothetical protein
LFECADTEALLALASGDQRAAGEFGERDADPIADWQVRKAIVAAAEVMHERGTGGMVRVGASRFSPRVGRCRDVSRP